MPHGPLDACHSTQLAIECPACGNYSEKPLAWLKLADLVDCDACGLSIDIATGERRAAIEKHYRIVLRNGA